jgi:two-component system, OmpR family, sensor histidine kinase KdpD
MANTDNDHERRASPEALLAVAQREHRGRLKVFLGAAPGVGKTYAMLQAAQLRRREGVDVLAGLVETHGRSETQALLAGLEALPRRRVEYRGTRLDEMDLDAILARHPQLVLVDELAHTNAPGSRHPKRYLDVEELIAAGIDVYTTVNIQHVESLNDTVAQITGVRIRETIPDTVLESADEIQLTDLPPEELIQRLHEGKVYVPDQAQRAIENYFRPGNLNALRELALRRTAESVDVQMQAYMQAQAIPGPWPTTERIMVCVSPSPLSARLVRAAKRRADRRHAEWLAAYVETPKHVRLSEADRDRVSRTLQLAEKLGGEAVSIPGRKAADDLIRYARSRNVTEIIIGKSQRPWWHDLRYGSIVSDLIRKSGRIDVYVISGEEAHTYGEPSSGLPAWRKPSLQGYLAGTLSVAGAGIAAKLLQEFARVPDVAMVFLLAVLFIALKYGLWPSIWASLLSVLVYDFCFVPPLLTFTVDTPEDVLALVVYFIAAVLTSNLAARTREQAEAARRREDRTSALFGLSRAVAASAGLDAVAQVIVSQVGRILEAKVVLSLPEGHRLFRKASHPSTVELTDHDQAAATWAWQHNQRAGLGSDTLPGVPWLFLPLRTGQETVGTLGIQFDPPVGPISPSRQRLLEGLADQAAVAIERTRLVQEMEQAKVLTETEKLRAALLSSVSHDLRTPLASIIGSASSLLTFGDSYDEPTKKDLLMTIQEEADRLNRFVGNLLDITRLESGKLQLDREWTEIQDVIGTALGRLQNPLKQHRLMVDTEPGLPLLRLDFVLMEQVFVNLLDNAAKYSQPGTTITIEARQVMDTVTVQVADQGVGVPPQDLEQIFDKFHRVRSGDRRAAGTGLGLSICRGIVEAHGGKISAVSAGQDKGTAISLVFPVEPQPTAMEQGRTNSG